MQEASTRGGIAKPLNKREREKFSPESLGLIAFGLSLLGGADMAQATQIGLQTYETVDDRRSLAKQREAVDKFIAQQPPELQEVLRVVGGDNKTIADLTMRYKEMQGDQAQAEAIQVQLQEADLTQEMQRRVAAADDPAAELTKVKEDARLAERNAEDMRTTHSRILADINAVRNMIGGEFYNEETGEIETVQGMSNDGNLFGNLDVLVPVMSAIPRTKAKDYAQRLASLKSNIGFGELQRMRKNSPTGGALGNTSDTEVEQLQSVLGAIGTATRYDTVLETLDKMEQVYDDMLRAAETDYSTYFNAPQATAGGSTQSFNLDGSQYKVR